MWPYMRAKCVQFKNPTVMKEERAYVSHYICKKKSAHDTKILNYAIITRFHKYKFIVSFK